MLVFLGLKIEQPILNKQKYKQALQEIRHYLSFKTKICLEQTQQVLTVSNDQYSFSLVKNPLFLHTNYYNMPILNQHDFQYMDICYQCLLIIRESFPSSAKIQMVTDSELKQLQSFEERKLEEFNRRLNSNLKHLIENTDSCETQDIQDLIFMIAHHYTKKNKISALKMLVSKVNSDNINDLKLQFFEYLQEMQSEADLKKIVAQVIAKIKHIKNSQPQQSQNVMKESNMSIERYAQNIKLQPLIFQLKQSYQLQRICSLLTGVLNIDQDKEYYCKLQNSIQLITNKFVAEQFQGMEKYGPQFASILKRFWQKRGKKWQQNVKESIQSKCRELNAQSRMNSTKSKNKLASSRKYNHVQ